MTFRMWETYMQDLKENRTKYITIDVDLKMSRSI